MGDRHGRPVLEPRAHVSDEILERYRKVTSATAYSGVWRLKPPGDAEWFASATWQRCLMHDVWPLTPRRRELPDGSGEQIALLHALLKLRCEEQDVAPRLVATRDDLEKILADPNAPVRALSGWRRELFGEDALALLRGEIGLTGARGGLRLLRLNES